MRVYYVTETGTLEMVDRAMVDGVLYTNAGYPMTRTEETRTLRGWPDTNVRVWVMDNGAEFLVPEDE